VLDEEGLRNLVKKIEAAPLVGFDTECVGTEPMTARLVGMSFAFGGEAFYLPLGHDYPGVQQQIDLRKALESLKPWLERDDCRKVAQDAKFDSHVLANRGVRLAGCVHDTVLESYVLEVHERRDLGSLAQRHCGWTKIGYDEVTGKGVARIPFSGVDIARATQYAAEEADCTLALHEILFPRIEQDEKLRFVMKKSSCRPCRSSSAWRGTAWRSTPPVEAQSHEPARR